MGFVCILLYVLLLLKNYYYNRGYISIFRFAGILFLIDYFFSRKRGYRECLGFVCMLYELDYFLVLMGVI